MSLSVWDKGQDLVNEEYIYEIPFITVTMSRLSNHVYLTIAIPISLIPSRVLDIRQNFGIPLFYNRHN